MRFDRALAIAGAMALSACSSSAADPNTTSTSAAAGGLSISVSSGDLSPAFTTDVQTYELTSFTTLHDVSLTVSGGTAHVLGQTTSDGVPLVLPKLAITPGATLQVAMEGGATYTIDLAPADLPAFTFTSDNPEPGKIFLTPLPFLSTTTPTPYLLTVSTNGDILYYLRKPAEMSTDLKRQVLPDGSVYMTYISGGLAHLLDADMNPIRDYSIISTTKHPAGPADNHDIKVLGPNHVIIEGTIKETVTNVPFSVTQQIGTSNVYASVIQEIEDGQVVFDWQTTDFPELYGLSTEANAFLSDSYQDYSHLNSVVIDPATNNLMASFRHLDCILGINRTDGSIMWRLGNTNDSFGTTAEQKTSHQHFASYLEDGRIMVYDNGNASQMTRILTIGLDTTNMKVTSFESMPLDGYFSQYMGSTQPVATNSLLVGLGAVLNAPDVIMFDRTSLARTFTLTLSADDYYSYRAMWEDGL